MIDSMPDRPARTPRILVIGDLILDRYTWGDATRVSPEAPIPILAADQEEVRPGGAASVAALLARLDVAVTLLGVIGDDSEGETLRKIVSEYEVDIRHLAVIEERPTTCKHRFVGRAAGRHPHQMLRVDREDRTPIDSNTGDLFIEALRAGVAAHDVVLVSDYAKGVCTPRLLQNVISVCQAAQVPVLVDPSRHTELNSYRGATLVTPNRIEAQWMTGRPLLQPDGAVLTATQLREQLDVDAVLVTLDRDGMVLADERQSRHIPTTPRDVYDITGAGDMVLAMFGYGYAARWPPETIAEIANIAAGLEVERLGVEPVNWTEIEAEFSAHGPQATKICSLAEAVRFAESARHQGQSIAFTNGCFDLFHAGHLQTLQAAAVEGDFLIVAINSDASIRNLKGPTRPIIPQQQRAELLAALECVDRVIIFEEETPHRLLHTIRPDVLVKGGTTTHIVGREVVEAYGGLVTQVGITNGISTTALIDRINQTHDSQTDRMRM